VTSLHKEREATTTVVDIKKQQNLFEGINSITCEEGSGHHFTGYCPEVKKASEQQESCSEEAKEGIGRMNSTRVESLTKGDAHDRGIVKAKKQTKLLDRRGKPIRCFLCNLNHFAHNCPLKETLERMVKNQEQIAMEKLVVLGGVNQSLLKPTKAMMEEVEELTKKLDEFKMQNHGQRSQDKDGRLCFVDVMVSGVKVAALVDTRSTHNFISERNATSLHCKTKGSMATFKVVNSEMKPMTAVALLEPLRVGSWFGTWDVMVNLLDDHAMILGKEFLKHAKAVPVPHGFTWSSWMKPKHQVCP
jgi:hypothetical protein